jgi:CRISPR-associated protein Cas1
MNPLLLSGFGISIEVNKARLMVKQKDSVLEFEPHRMPYDSVIIDGHYGSISFEAMRWLSKHEVSIALLNWNGNLLSNTTSQETLNAHLKIKQYEKYLNQDSRLYIAGQIVKQKVNASINLIKSLSNYYKVDLSVINKEIERIDYYNINSLMMYEGRIASAYWSILSGIFNKLAPDFNFQSRKNLSYSWNMNASDPVNALLNYGYAILESAGTIQICCGLFSNRITGNRIEKIRFHNY